MIGIGFWGSLLVLLQTYLVFPAVVLLRAAVRPRPYEGGARVPSVAVVIAAHDEAAAIGLKLQTVLQSHYPGNLLEVIVASDGSTDATVAIVDAIGDPRVRCLDLDRQGKAAALNAALDQVGDAEIVVFTDANSLLEPGAIAALVVPFADPEVGAVAGDQRYLPAQGADLAKGERSYWSFDRVLKAAESRAGNVIGATGALYAVRKELVPPVLEGVTDDFTTSTAVIAAGRRLVFCGEAVAWEPVAPSTSHEFARKVRVMSRGLRGVVVRRELLDPRAHGFYAYQFVNHKVARRLMGIPLIVLGLSSVAGARRSRLLRLAAIGQAGFYGAAALGAAAPDTKVGRSKPCQLASYFCMVNLAGLVAASNLVRGRRVVTWESPRANAEEGT